MINQPEHLPIGTIIVQYVGTIGIFFKVVRTSKKSITVIEMPDRQTRFDHTGGGCGYSFKMPDEKQFNHFNRLYKYLCSKYGFDVLDTEASSDNFKKIENDESWLDLMCNKNYVTQRRVMVKFKDGDFTIPGIYKYSRTSNCLIWDGNEIADYYGE